VQTQQPKNNKLQTKPNTKQTNYILKENRQGKYYRMK
jgi:hypothetical protein